MKKGAAVIMTAYCILQVSGASHCRLTREHPGHAPSLNGNIVYKDGEFVRILLEEGHIGRDTTGVYHFYAHVKDYQGNIRLIVDENNKVVESNEYYPYGMPRHAVGESSQPYKFGGKESWACRLGVIGIML